MEIQDRSPSRAGEYDNFLALVTRAREGDVPSREKIVAQNLYLVQALLKRMVTSPAEGEDLYQVGCLGLLKAIDGFDPARGCRFSTYAVPVVLGEMRMYLRKDGAFKVSRSLAGLAVKIKGKREEFMKQRGREPSLGELAEAFQVSREEIVLAQEAGRGTLSLEELQGEGGLMESFSNPLGKRENDYLIDRLAFKEIVSSLEARERKLIYYRFIEEKTQEETAALLQTSQRQVSRLEKKILQKIRYKYQEGPVHKKTLPAHNK